MTYKNFQNFKINIWIQKFKNFMTYKNLKISKFHNLQKFHDLQKFSKFQISKLIYGYKNLKIS